MDNREFQIEMGQKIRAVRNERGLSLRQLAPICGLHHDHIWRLEKGDYDPKISTLMKVAKALNVDFRSFL